MAEEMQERTSAGRDWGSIYAEMFSRRNADSVIFRQMQEVKFHYNGDIAIPIADVDGKTIEKPMSARLVTEAVDALSRQACLSKPTITCPPLEPFKETGKRSKEYAAIRRRALYARWDDSALGDVLLRRAYRHFAGYGTCCFVVLPDFEKGGARVELRDPLTSYPELRSLDDVREPMNCGFVYGRSVDWIRANFPETREYMSANSSFQGLWDVVEWIDKDVIVLGILGPRGFGESWSWLRVGGPGGGMELRRWKNRAGYVPVAVPRRVTLDRLMGITDASLGTIMAMERMVLLDEIAAEKAIFGDMVIIGQDGREARLVGGKWHDGRSGIPNELVDGDIKILSSSPGPLTHPVTDRLERNFRVSTGLIPQTGGENFGGLRTGRALDAIGGFSVDPRCQEAQEIVARSLKCVNEGIEAVERGYFPKRKFTVFSGWPGEHGLVEYTPEVHFETNANTVTYAFPGTNVSEMSVALGQLLGAEVISRRTARFKHPFVEDPEGEERQVVLEKMTEAFLQSQLQLAAAGQLPQIDQMRVMELYSGGKTLWEATAIASRESQERQAAQAPPPQPGMGAAPEAQPGLAAPGAGVESLPPSIEPPSQGQLNFRELHQALTSGSTQRR